MPSRKASVAKKSAVPIPSVDAPVGSWKISQSLQLPLLITLTLTLSTLLRSFSNKFTAAALDGTSRSSDSKWEVGALLVWKAYVVHNPPNTMRLTSHLIDSSFPWGGMVATMAVIS
jgi:hypothetical protein